MLYVIDSKLSLSPLQILNTTKLINYIKTDN